MEGERAPVWKKVMPGSWLMASVCIVRRKRRSSTILAVWGISSLTQNPDSPYWSNLNVDGTIGKPVWFAVIAVKAVPFPVKAVPFPDRLGQVGGAHFRDLRFVLPQLVQRRGAVLEQVDDPLRLGREVGRPGQPAAGNRRLGDQILIEQGCQGGCTGETLPPFEVENLRAQAERLEAEGPAESFELQCRNLARNREAGMIIGMGTDSGVNVGWTTHTELRDMAGGGLTPMEVIEAATRVNAEILGLDDLGTVAAGKNASFVVLDANLLDDIGNTRRIASIYLGGVPVDRAALRATFMDRVP